MTEYVSTDRDRDESYFIDVRDVTLTGSISGLSSCARGSHFVARFHCLQSESLTCS